MAYCPSYTAVFSMDIRFRAINRWSLQAAPKPAVDANVGIQTAVRADLPVLSQMLSQLFESSQYLDDVALHHLIDALGKLSQEAMELAYTNRETENHPCSQWQSYWRRD